MSDFPEEDYITALRASLCKNTQEVFYNVTNNYSSSCYYVKCIKEMNGPAFASLAIVDYKYYFCLAVTGCTPQLNWVSMNQEK